MMRLSLTRQICLVLHELKMSVKQKKIIKFVIISTQHWMKIIIFFALSLYSIICKTEQILQKHQIKLFLFKDTCEWTLHIWQQYANHCYSAFQMFRQSGFSRLIKLFSFQNIMNTAKQKHKTFG